MAVTLGFLNEDKSTMKSIMTLAVRRRRQLVEWTLSADDFMEIFYDSLTARAMRHVRDNYPRALHWGAMMNFNLPVEHPRFKLISIQVITETPMPMPIDFNYKVTPMSVTIASQSNQTTTRLRNWAWRALQIELENQWTIQTAMQIVSKATTHQQVHRYMPEIYTLLANEERDIPMNKWDRRRILDLHEELNTVGSSRARSLEIPKVSPKHRLAMKNIIAQMLMIPRSEGMKVGSGFHLTWVLP